MMPSHEKLEDYRSLIVKRYPMLHNVWGAMDCLKIRIEEPPDKIIHSCFYNDQKSNHFVTSVPCFALDGTIHATFYHVP
jgi:hypothetical protein